MRPLLPYYYAATIYVSSYVYTSTEHLHAAPAVCVLVAAAIYVSSYYYAVTIYVSSYVYTSTEHPNAAPAVCVLVAAAIYVSSYYGIRFLILLYVLVYVSSTLMEAPAVYVSCTYTCPSCCIRVLYVYVSLLLYTCPVRIRVPSPCYIRVLVAYDSV
jgi:hypothetical protein